MDLIQSMAIIWVLSDQIFLQKGKEELSAWGHNGSFRASNQLWWTIKEGLMLGNQNFQKGIYYHYLSIP